MNISKSARRRALATLQKAARETDAMVRHLQASSLTRNQLADVLWNDENHGAPSKEDIKTGPSQAASGGGAEKMVRDYSKPAPQVGQVRAALELADLMKAARALGLLKAEDDDETDDDDLVLTDAEDEDEQDDDLPKCRTAHGRAIERRLLAKAKRALKRHDDDMEAAADDMDRDDDEDEAMPRRRRSRGEREETAKALARLEQNYGALVDGTSMVRAGIFDVLNAVSGGSLSARRDGTFSELVKAELPLASRAGDIVSRINAAEDSGRLSDTDAFSAREIAGLAAGGAPSETIQTKLKMTSAVVRSIFAGGLDAAHSI